MFIHDGQHCGATLHNRFDAARRDISLAALDCTLRHATLQYTSQAQLHDDVINGGVKRI